MCGIFCTITCEKHVEQGECNKQLQKNRGPDAYDKLELILENNWHAFFSGSTLWTQGSGVKSQPLIHSDGSVLLWNGDKYSDDEATDLVSITENDSEEVLSHLISGDISYFEEVNGPYSFIFYHNNRNELWFGRDGLGRHSLLWFVSQNSIFLCSTVEQNCPVKVTEIPSCGLFKISLSSTEISIDVYPWSHMVPKAITIDVPFSVKKLLSHSLLRHCTDYFWTIEEPTEFELILNEHNSRDDPQYIFAECLSNSYYFNVVMKLKDLLFRSVQRRVKTKPDFCKNCLKERYNCKHTKVGVLFSGGLDSAIIALLSDSFVPEDEPIDLLNVSFIRSPEHSFDDVPDRKTGKNTLEELKFLCPQRIWNFVEINISQEELQFERQNHIRNLINPLNSVLDDSLGCALWFAARGRGTLNQQLYTSSCRILLLGMGADEMFGGYSRHRRTFKSSGWSGLTRDLYNDLRHIGERNLGRDNRVVADHGRQPRLPYLDEEFVAAVDSIATWIRCDLRPGVPAGIGDKLLLRILAWHLGFRSTATLPKKALQFGSHIANPKDKGHMLSKNL